MPDYQNTKIYIIRSRNTDRVYIGATTSTLVKRFSAHNRSFAKGNYQCRARDVLEHGDCYIELLERYPCLDKDESNAREKYWMRQFDEQRVNYKLPGRTRVQYHQDNREVISEKKKQYRRDNLQKLKEKNRKWYQANKQILTEKIECPCGSIHIRCGGTRHHRSKMHKTWVHDQHQIFNHL